MAGEHDNVDQGSYLLYFFKGIDTALSRHQYIQEHHIKILCLDEPEGVVAVKNNGNLKLPNLKTFCKDIGKIHFVINNQHLYFLRNLLQTTPAQFGILKIRALCLLIRMPNPLDKVSIPMIRVFTIC